MPKLVLFVLSAALAGCAHQLILTPLDGGPPGTGTAPAANSGVLSVLLDGQTYTGDFVYMPNGGSVGTVSTFAGGQFAMGTIVGQPASGNGRANLRAPNGSSLRCAFDYNALSGTGVGQCESNTGRGFDLLIK